MKDRHGHEYDILRTYQADQLRSWEARLQPKLHAEVSEYVLAQNKPADTENLSHQVFRGQDLIQIIMEWPNLGTYYPKPGSELI